MLSILNILVPVVLSKRCAWAARYSARLASELGSQLYFFNVGQQNKASTVEAFVPKEIGATPHKSIVVDGDPATRIIECATELEADVIVMPHVTGAITHS